MNKVLKCGWLVLLFVFLWAGCAKQERPALVVGTSGEVPPFSWHGPDAGPEVVGFDMAIGQAIAQKARRPLKVEVMPSEELLPAVAAGKVDVALNRLVIPVEMIEGCISPNPIIRPGPRWWYWQGRKHRRPSKICEIKLSGRTSVLRGWKLPAR